MFLISFVDTVYVCGYVHTVIWEVHAQQEMGGNGKWEEMRDHKEMLPEAELGGNAPSLSLCQRNIWNSNTQSSVCAYWNRQCGRLAIE